MVLGQGTPAGGLRTAPGAGDGRRMGLLWPEPEVRLPPAAPATPPPRPGSYPWPGPPSGGPGGPRTAVPGPRSRVWRVARRLLVAVLLLQLVSAGFIVTLRWWAPDRTAFMLQDTRPVIHQHVSLEHVSRYTIAAAIAHEDEELGPRPGAFTVAAFSARVAAYLHGRPDPTGSTIPQQLAKNVFLWPHQDPARKAIEAVLASELSLALPDQRVMELYLDYAQFGPHLYGICAASWYYFGEAPWDVTQYQADQLMGVLPDPDRVTRAPGGGIDIGAGADPAAVDLVNGAANVHVPAELAGMGGWQAAVATIGIHDTAGAHAADRGNADACSTMPPAVAARIAGR
ncbi:MAG: monofunctional biosynthetic peptidoglycan transglycosylase [Modestobacter sp.]|nr:monofunctional biosynthetic peptidoglycan transglycosylase [Modestobacter sp.]